MAEQNESGWNDGRVTDEPIKSAHYRESGFEEKPLSREEPNNGNREEPNNDSRDRGSPRRSERRDDRVPRHYDDRERENPTPSKVLGVFGLSLRTEERDLEEIYSKYGTLEKSLIVYDRRSRQSRGFGFIYFDDVADATDARNATSGMELHGRRIRVDYSLTHKPHDSTPGFYAGPRPTRDDRDRRDSDRGGRDYDRDRRDNDRGGREYDRDRRDYDRGGRGGHEPEERGRERQSSRSRRRSYSR